MDERLNPFSIFPEAKTVILFGKWEPSIWIMRTFFNLVLLPLYQLVFRAKAEKSGAAIEKGISETEFAPNNNITREQIAAIMHRYATFKGIDVSVGENTNILSYDDFADISEYAISSMQWACGSGLMKGKTNTTLNPKDNATRAEIAAILHRFIKADK